MSGGAERRDRSDVRVLIVDDQKIVTEEGFRVLLRLPTGAAPDVAGAV